MHGERQLQILDKFVFQSEKNYEELHVMEDGAPYFTFRVRG